MHILYMNLHVVFAEILLATMVACNKFFVLVDISDMSFQLCPAVQGFLTLVTTYSSPFSKYLSHRWSSNTGKTTRIGGQEGGRTHGGSSTNETPEIFVSEKYYLKIVLTKVNLFWKLF